MRHLTFLRKYLSVAILVSASLAYSATVRVAPDSTCVGDCQTGVNTTTGGQSVCAGIVAPCELDDDAFGYECSENTEIEGVVYLAPLTFTVTFEVNGYGSISGDQVQTVAAGGDAVAVEAVADAGFVFVHWTVAGTELSTENPLTLSNVLEDTTITAVFEVKTYTFTSISGSGGSVSPLGTISVVEGNSQSYSIVAEAGFAISNVVVDGTSVGRVSSYTFTDAADDHTISVNFYVLDRDGNGGCSLSSISSGSNTLAMLGIVFLMLVLSTRLRSQESSAQRV